LIFGRLSAEILPDFADLGAGRFADFPERFLPVVFPELGARAFASLAPAAFAEPGFLLPPFFFEALPAIAASYQVLLLIGVLAVMYL
jgi:hypothetical protein